MEADPRAPYGVPAGLDSRVVTCECGFAFSVEPNVLRVICPRCSRPVATSVVPGVLQR